MSPAKARVATAEVGLDDATLRRLADAAQAEVDAPRPVGTPSSSRRPQGILRYNVARYLEGVLWVVQMYADGYCPDFSWEYAAEIAPS